MAFCPKCGTAIPEGSTVKFCGTCGQPLEVNAAPEKKETTINTDEMLEKGKEIVGDVAEKGKEIAGDVAEKGKALANEVAETVKNVDVNEVIENVKAGDKKTIGILAGLAAAVVLVVVLIFNIFGGSYMDPINNTLKLMNNKNTDYYALTTSYLGDYGKAIKKATDLQVEYEARLYSYGSYTYEDRYDDYEERLDDVYEKIDDEYKNWKISFEKKEAEKADKDDIESFEEGLQDLFDDNVEKYEEILKDDDELEDYAEDLDVSEDEAEKIAKAYLDAYKKLKDAKVSSAYEVKGKFVMKADGDKLETDTVTLIVAKVNGSWMYVTALDSIQFEDDNDRLFYPLTSLFHATSLYY